MKMDEDRCFSVEYTARLHSRYAAQLGFTGRIDVYAFVFILF